MEMEYLLFCDQYGLPTSGCMFNLSESFYYGYLLYTRWLSIHHYDMKMLKDTNLEVFQEFSVHGNFTVARTQQIIESGFGSTSQTAKQNRQRYTELKTSG